MELFCASADGGRARLFQIIPPGQRCFQENSALICAEDETIWRADRNYSLRWHSRSGIPAGLPVRQPLRNERRTFLIVATVQNVYVVRIGAPIDTGCARVHIRICICASREVPGCAVSGFQLDLAYSVQLRRVWIQRTLTLPIIEDARRLLSLLRRLAPVSC